MSPTPLEAYCTWLEQLPPELGEELARALMLLFPGDLLVPAMVVGRASDGLVARIRRSAAGPTVRETGTVAALAAVTDLIFLERGTEEGAERTRGLLDILAEAEAAMSELGTSMGEEVAEWIEAQRLGHPLRAKRWAKERASWEALREGPLSPRALFEDLVGRRVGRRPEP